MNDNFLFKQLRLQSNLKSGHTGGQMIWTDMLITRMCQLVEGDTFVDKGILDLYVPWFTEVCFS